MDEISVIAAIGLSTSNVLNIAILDIPEYNESDQYLFDSLWDHIDSDDWTGCPVLSRVPGIYELIWNGDQFISQRIIKRRGWYDGI